MPAAPPTPRPAREHPSRVVVRPVKPMGNAAMSAPEPLLAKIKRHPIPVVNRYGCISELRELWFGNGRRADLP